VWRIDPVDSQQPDQIGGDFLTTIIEPINLIEHEPQHSGVRRKLRDVPGMQRFIGVLLWIGYPHENIDDFDEPVNLEPMLDRGRVMIGQVEQNKAVEFGFSVENSVPFPDFEPIE